MKKKQLFFALLGASAATPAFAQYTFSTMVSFNATYGGPGGPWAAPLVVGNTLYGTTAWGGLYKNGTVYSMPTTGGTPTVLASFSGNSTGSYPESTPVLSGGKLYGTTVYGGAYGDGVVFSRPVTGGTPTVLASFNGTNGSGDCGMLVLAGGKVYGATYDGGTSNVGTVYSVSTSGGNITTLATFNATNGANPDSLVVFGTTLYGVTTNGGAYGDGTVFSVPIAGGNITTLATFNGPNGNWPGCNLVLSGSSLYGTAPAGGPNNDGTVFSVPVTCGNITTLASFNGTNGSAPQGNIVMDSSGNIYGTTWNGGANGAGVVFSIPSAGGAPIVLASFGGTNGYGPYGGLVMDASGNLYGPTQGGGTYNDGTLFELVAPVPEPASLSLLAVGGIGLLARRRRR